jgi:hypothetical protein
MFISISWVSSRGGLSTSVAKARIDAGRDDVRQRGLLAGEMQRAQLEASSRVWALGEAT